MGLAPALNVVYTVITGDYDNLRPVANHNPKWRYVCFSDRPRQCAPWEIQPFPQVMHSPARNARIPKCLPHLLLPDAEHSVYIDGQFRMQCNPDDALALLGECDVAMFSHPGGHKSIHDERNFYQKLHGYVPVDIEMQYQRYCAAGVPDVGRFWAGGVVIRRHTTPIEAFNETWFSEYVNGSSNDQFALYRAAVAEDVWVVTIPGVITMDNRFGFVFHTNSGGSDNPAFETDNAEWAARVAKIKDLCAYSD